MRTYIVEVNEKNSKGEIMRKSQIPCDVRGDCKDETTLLKRLTNNVKTWQSAWNKGQPSNDKWVFEIVSYKEKVKGC
jgi:hypothetical protein